MKISQVKRSGEWISLRSLTLEVQTKLQSMHELFETHGLKGNAMCNVYSAGVNQAGPGWLGLRLLP